MIASDITVAMVIDAYKEHGFNELSRLFGADKNGKICVTNNRKVKNKICDYLKTKYLIYFSLVGIHLLYMYQVF